MHIDKLCTSLKTSIELCQNGFPQDGFFWWVDGLSYISEINDTSTDSRFMSKFFGLVYVGDSNEGSWRWLEKEQVYLAPTVAEISEQLKDESEKSILEAYGHVFNVPDTRFITERGLQILTSDVEVMARMWLYLNK